MEGKASSQNMKYKKWFVLLNIFSIFWLSLGGIFLCKIQLVNAQRYWIAPPTILFPKDGSVVYTATPIIKGVSFNDTIVEIWVNDKLDGVVKVKNHSSGTGSFVYKLKTPLKNLRTYNLKIKAKDVYSDIESDFSAKITFNTLLPPTPFIIQPKNNQIIRGKREIDIKGLVKSGNKVNLIINGKTVKQVVSGISKTGTSGFYFKSPRVKGGRLFITLYAVDKKGNVSALSDIREVFVIPPYIPPTLRKITKNRILEGVAYQNSKVEIYVNNKIDGSFKVKTSPTKVVGFRYKLKSLKPGKNLIKARAYNLKNNWPSDDSNILTYYFRQIPKKKVSVKPSKEKLIPPAPVTKSEEKPLKGEISEQGSVIKKEIPKQAQEQVQEINWPFIIGIILLVLLILSLVFWYILQRKESINQSIEELIEKKEEKSVKTQEQTSYEPKQETIIEKSTEEKPQDTSNQISDTSESQESSSESNSNPPSQNTML